MRGHARGEALVEIAFDRTRRPVNATRAQARVVARRTRQRGHGGLRRIAQRLHGTAPQRNGQALVILAEALAGAVDAPTLALAHQREIRRLGRAGIAVQLHDVAAQLVLQARIPRVADLDPRRRIGPLRTHVDQQVVQRRALIRLSHHRPRMSGAGSAQTGHHRLRVVAKAVQHRVPRRDQPHRVRRRRQRAACDGATARLGLGAHCRVAQRTRQIQRIRAQRGGLSIQQQIHRHRTPCLRNRSGLPPRRCARFAMRSVRPTAWRPWPRRVRTGSSKPHAPRGRRIRT